MNLVRFKYPWQDLVELRPVEVQRNPSSNVPVHLSSDQWKTLCHIYSVSRLPSTRNRLALSDANNHRLLSPLADDSSSLSCLAGQLEHSDGMRFHGTLAALPLLGAHSEPQFSVQSSYFQPATSIRRAPRPIRRA